VLGAAEMVRCEICGKVLKNKSGLSGHLRLAHAVAVSGQRSDNVPANVNIEFLGHRVAQCADNVRPVAAVTSASSAQSEERLINGVSLEHLSDSAIALGFRGLGAKVDRITVDGVPVKYLSDEALKIVWKGARFILRERGVTDFLGAFPGVVE